jgi:7-cyano-7-deazaguanine synthase
MSVQQKPAVVLLSGGLDSATVLAIAKRQGFAAYAITFRYGQRHRSEIEAATKIAKAMAVKQHIIADIDLRIFGGSALTADIDVPKGETPQQGIPITYVPARNTIFLSFALAWAEVLGSDDIFIGANSVDYSGYPDCRPEFMDAFARLANLATKAGVEGRQKMKVHAPLMQLSKAQIIAEGLKLGVDYGMTISCYDPADGKACGRCDACQLRRRGFEQNGSTDPTG